MRSDIYLVYSIYLLYSRGFDVVYIGPVSSGLRGVGMAHFFLLFGWTICIRPYTLSPGVFINNWIWMDGWEGWSGFVCL